MHIYIYIYIERERERKVFTIQSLKHLTSCGRYDNNFWEANKDYIKAKYDKIL